MNQEFMSKINGLLLGDGCIAVNNTKNISKSGECRISTGYRYIQGSINKSWLDDIGMWLLSFGVKFGIHIDKYATSKLPVNIFYKLNSGFNDCFKSIRNNWYKPIFYEDKNGFECFRNKKIVPRDIQLTPECVANWYMGDGCLSPYHNRKNQYRIEIGTCGFNHDDVEHLVFLLNDQVVEGAYRGKSSNNIWISRKNSVNSFLEYVFPYMIPCFNYKIKEEFL